MNVEGSGKSGLKLFRFFPRNHRQAALHKQLAMLVDLVDQVIFPSCIIGLVAALTNICQRG